MDNEIIKVLLCSPVQMVGGIAQWTRIVLEYYNGNRNSTNIDLCHYHCSGKKSIHGNTSLIIRCMEGIKTYLKLYVGLKKMLENNHFEIVHFCTSASISLTKDIFLLRTVRRRGLKTIVHFHFGRISELYDKRNWEQKLLHQVIKLADKAIVIDELSYKTLINNGYNNIELLPNPLSPKIGQTIEENSTVARIDRKIVFAGHVVRMKGVFELVEACRNIENIQLKMLGYVSDEMKSELMKRAGANSDWLDIAGEHNTETVIKEILSANVFVLPTYTEGFPNVILESMACACPIVTTAVGGIPEMLDIKGKNNCGICIEPKNIEQLKSAVIRMLEDREFAVQCGKNAQKRVNELYSMSKVWNKMENIWESLTIVK